MYSPISTLSYQTTRDTTIRTCLEKPPYNNNHLYAILHETQLYLPAYSNHLTITTSCLPYCQRNNCTYLPTATILNNNHLSTILPETQLYYTYLPIATTLYKQPPIYHTTRDTTILTCLQQPLYNNNHMSTILPETQLYLPAYSNHLTITTTYLPYYQRHNYTYLPTATTLQ